MTQTTTWHYPYPMGSGTATIVPLRILHPHLYLNSKANQQNNALDYVEVLLARRKYDVQTFAGYWSLVGGFVDIGKENTVQCAARELREETGLTISEDQFWLITTHSDPSTDPRAHVFNTIYGVYLPIDCTPRASDDIEDVKWVNCGEWFKNQQIVPQKLAFNHSDLLITALKYIMR